MKPLREWIEDEIDRVKILATTHEEFKIRLASQGMEIAYWKILDELKAHEDAGQGGEAERWRNLLREVLVGDTTMAERTELMRDLGVEREGDADRVNENLSALDHLAAKILEEKEGGAE